MGNGSDLPVSKDGRCVKCGGKLEVHIKDDMVDVYTVESVGEDGSYKLYWSSEYPTNEGTSRVYCTNCGQEHAAPPEGYDIEA